MDRTDLKPSRALLPILGIALVVVIALAALAFTGGRDGDGGGAWSWLTGGGSEASPDSSTSAGGPSSPPEGSGSDEPVAPGGPGSPQAGGPVPDGSALATVTTPPASTLAMVEAKRLPADARYSIAFRPYGYGPGGAGSTLVIKITEVTSGGQGAPGFDFVGRNVLAYVSPGTNQTTVGGTYSGVLTFRAQGDLMVPLLSEIKAE